jgi:hypothetical protein
VGFLVYQMSFEDHVIGQPLYVDPSLRVCPGCKEGANIHQLKKFRKGEGHQYSTLCNVCEKEDRKFENSQASKTAVTVLENTIKDIKKARKGGVQHGYGDVLRIACDGMGGIEKTFKMVGAALRKALEAGSNPDSEIGEMTLALKAAQTLLSSAQLENTKKNSVDLSQLTDEELQDILMEPAKELLMNSKEFRKQMLDHPDVRALFAKDTGVTILDSELRDPA